MHFSRPSACRLSTCRPWQRGAVGRFSSGYSSVTGFLNIVEKVTPNPAIGANRSFSGLPAPLGRGDSVGSVTADLRGLEPLPVGLLRCHVVHLRASGQDGN